MTSSHPTSACVCGSGRLFADCCGPVLDGVPARTAVSLMRSRFAAFALALPDHLLATWHPDTRPRALELDPSTTWRRLQIVDTVAGGDADATGVVEFRASFLDGGAAGLLHERSRFARVDRRWFYVDGD